MRFNSTQIRFNNETPKEFLQRNSASYSGNIWFGTTEKDMYKEELSGSRELISEKIPGRDQPYFYKVDHGVLEFDMVLAFEDSIKENELKDVVNWLYQDNYNKLEFGTSTEDVFQNRFFYVIFTNKPTVKYVITQDDSGEDVIMGYLKLHAKCNSSTGFEEKETLFTGTETTDGDPSTSEYEITLDNTGGALSLLYHIELKGNGSEITLNDISYGTEPTTETLTIKNDIKSIESTSGRNVYEDLDPKEFIEIPKGETKTILITGISDSQESKIIEYKPVYL